MILFLPAPDHPADRARAIEHYQKSLELNPDNRNAVAMLEKLGEQGQAPKTE